MKTILIAEDEGTIALNLKKIVENMGIEVTEIVKKGEDLIIAVEKFVPSLIIADISLKGELDGIEALARIREKIKIPYIFITGHRDFERIIELYNLNPCKLIYKPFNNDDLNKIIRECIS